MSVQLQNDQNMIAQGVGREPHRATMAGNSVLE